MKSITFYILIIIMIFNNSIIAEEMKSNGNLSELHPGYTRRYGIGIKMKKFSLNQIIITGIGNDTPAAKAGLKIGDILKSIDGIPIAKKYDLIEACKSRDYNTEIELEIIRNGSIKRFKIKLSRVIDVPSFVDAIQRQIYSDKKMNLVVLVTDVKYVGNYDNSSITIIKNWKESTKKSVLALCEEALMQLKDEENFTLVDRNKTSELLKEISLSQSGLTSTNSINKIGELLNATHILFVDYTRYVDPNNSEFFTDSSTRRLIEIQSGAVLLSDEVRIKKPITEK